jgi:hypothetical protein
MSMWAARLGAFMLLLSPLLPQCRGAGKSFSAIQFLGELSGVVSPVDWLGNVAWMLSPLVGGSVILAGRWRRTAPGPARRILALIVLLAVALESSTLGSVLLTDTGTSPLAPTISFPLAMVLFLSPILLAGIALAGVLGGDFAGSSGRFTRGALAVLLGLNGLFLCDCGWDILFAWIKGGAAPHALPGAGLGPLGAMLVVVGEMIYRPLPRPAMDTVPASG